MTLEEARAAIGEQVTYRCCPIPGCTPPQSGRVKRVNCHWAFIEFGPGTTPQACDPADLTLAGPEREVTG